METEGEQERTETTAEPQPTRQESRDLKLRDLRPEKDPMGAGNGAAQSDRVR